MAHIMMGIGILIKWRDKGNKFGLMAHHMKDNGLRIVFMAKEFINGLKEKNIMENINMTKRMVMEYLNLLMVEGMKVIGLMVNKMVKVLYIFLMVSKNQGSGEMVN